MATPPHIQAGLLLLISLSSCQPASAPTPVATNLQATTATALPQETVTRNPVLQMGLAGLLAECRVPLTVEPSYIPFEPCDGLTLSEDGQFLAFSFGPRGCGRDIMVVDLVNNRTAYKTSQGDASFEFLTNATILITTSYCEGGYVSLLDPSTSQVEPLGDWGKDRLWNPSRTAFVVTVGAYHGFESGIWGYNLAKDVVFLRQLEPPLRDDDPLWTPDGTHLLFQRLLLYSKDSTYYFTMGRQIVRVDAITAEETVLTSDAVFSFNLCDSDNSCVWHGDWIPVRRFPFHPQTVEYTLEVHDVPEVKCLEFALGCAQAPDLFALNWRTGQLVPWNENLLPTPIPRPTPTEGPPPPGSG